MAETWFAAKTCVPIRFTRSKPNVVTGDTVVLRIIHDHARATLCWMRPRLSPKEQQSETAPMTPVYKKMSGTKIKYERSRLKRCIIGGSVSRLHGSRDPCR